MRLRLGSLAYTLLASAFVGCGSGDPPNEPTETAAGCSDVDGDGWGVGPDCHGRDCDDGNPYEHECADCSVDPRGAGCPCDAREPVPCYDGPTETAEVSPCAPGVRACADGFWSSCRGQTVPAAESCNQIDDDCDRSLDDGVGNECGACGGTCEEDVIGGTGDPWDLKNAGGRGGLVIETDGALGLDAQAFLLPYIWIPQFDTDTSEASVVKIDTHEREVLGRYRVPEMITGVSTNLESNVVVASASGTSFDGSSTGRVTRVNVFDCPDGPTSSSDDDVLPFGQDACVVWSTVLEGNAASSGVAWEVRDVLDGVEHYVWVSDQHVPDSRGIRELTEDGSETGRNVTLESFLPGALSMDSDGVLWSMAGRNNEGGLAKVDPVAAELLGLFPTPEGEPGCRPSCVAADDTGLVWTSGSTNHIFSVETEQWFLLDMSWGWGIAVDVDAVWFGGEWDVTSFDRRDPYGSSFDVGYAAVQPSPTFLALDLNGEIWAVTNHHNEAHVFSPDAPKDFTVGVDTLRGPGTCGDMTGTQLQSVVGPSTYEQVFEGCAESGTQWTRIRYDARFEGDAQARFEVRTAETLPELADAAYVTVGVAPGHPSPLDVATALFREGARSAHLLQLRITLHGRSERDRPRLSEVGVLRACGELPD